MSESTSNVRVVSNVYPVSTVRALDLPGVPPSLHGVCDDPKFRRRIRGKAALKKLGEYKCGLTIDERDLLERLLDNNLVQPWQVAAYWKGEGDGRCVDCAAGDRPIGLRRKGSKYELVNRCEVPNCRAR